MKLLLIKSMAVALFASVGVHAADEVPASNLRPAADRVRQSPWFYDVTSETILCRSPTCYSWPWSLISYPWYCSFLLLRILSRRWVPMLAAPRRSSANMSAPGQALWLLARRVPTWMILCFLCPTNAPLPARNSAVLPALSPILRLVASEHARKWLVIVVMELPNRQPVNQRILL